MRRFKSISRSLAQFKQVPPDLSNDEKHLFDSLAMFKDFLERILFKWNESFCIETSPRRVAMYFSRRKAWGAAYIPVVPSESLIYTEGRLCVEFFKVLQKLLRNKSSIVWHSLYTQHGRNLLADYSVHLLRLLETAQGVQGGSVRDHKAMIAKFWEVYEPRITERVTYFMSNGGELSIDTPLSWKRVEQWRVWREIRGKKQTAYNSKLPRAAAAKALSAIGIQEKEFSVDIFAQSGFSYPFTKPFPATSLLRFTYSRSPANVPNHVKMFFGELRRFLSTELHIEAHYVKVAEKKYAYRFTLYLDGWKWLVRRFGAPVCKENRGIGEHVSDTKESLREFEEEMAIGLWTDLTKALHMPLSAVDMVEKCQKVPCKKIASKAVELMRALKGWKTIGADGETDGAGPIWDRPFWKKTTSHGWVAAGFAVEGEEEIEERMARGRGVKDNGGVEEDRDEEETEEPPSRWKRKEGGVAEPVGEAKAEEHHQKLFSLPVAKELSTLKTKFKRPPGLSGYFTNILTFMEEVLSSTEMSLKFVQRFSEKNEPGDIIVFFVSEEKEEVFKVECKKKPRKPGIHHVLEEVFWQLKEANGLDPEIIPHLETEDPETMLRLSYATQEFLNDRLCT